MALIREDSSAACGVIHPHSSKGEQHVFVLSTRTAQPAIVDTEEAAASVRG